MNPALQTKPAFRIAALRGATAGVSGLSVAVFLALGAGGQLSALRAVAAAGTPAFHSDVLPVLTKAGCNSGACHGAATGQGGFRLSLLGYDPEEDFVRITREFGARRITLSNAEKTDSNARSLLLQKASGQIEHEGGRRLRRDSAGYALVQNWIASGAPYGPRDLVVTGISIEPAIKLLELTNAAFNLRVTALLSDGSRRDVSALALYTSNDEAVAAVTGSGSVTATGRGLTSIMVRYSGQVAAARIEVPVGDVAPDPSTFPSANFIDDPVRAGLMRLRIPASPLSEDAEFLRRVCLDLTGRLPEPGVARAFLGTPPSPEKRRQLIETLLAGDAFTDFWTMRLADLLLINGKTAGTQAYHRWLRARVAADGSLDQIGRDLLTATGAMAQVGPANFYALAGDPRDLSEHVGRMLLGTQIACARCHAHPSDRWTQDDYHGFAAYFARVNQDNGVVRILDRGEVVHPKTGRALEPKPLGATLRSAMAAGEVAGADDRRRSLAAWLAGPGSLLFARAMANRIWKHMTGRGLVEPVDDLRPTNPPTHPELLDALANELASHRFDLRHLVRQIANSRTYQLASATRGANRLDTRLYSHAYPKPLTAPVFADAVAQVTGVADHFDGYPPGTRAVGLISPAVASPALDVLGRCQRRVSCDGPAQPGGGLALALHLINGSTINDKLPAAVAGFEPDRPVSDVIEEMYLRALTRRPSPDELESWRTSVSQAGDRAEAFEDLLWTLLNSREFSLNH